MVFGMSAPAPPYEQVRREIIEQIRTGELKPGQKLPAIRAQAGVLGLAPGTVARAYKLLEEAQIIVTRRGAGTTVAADALAACERATGRGGDETQVRADPEVTDLFAGAVAEARRAGHSDLTILASVREALRER